MVRFTLALSLLVTFSVVLAAERPSLVFEEKPNYIPGAYIIEFEEDAVRFLRDSQGLYPPIPARQLTQGAVCGSISHSVGVQL
jgi:hypothetical protein